MVRGPGAHAPKPVTATFGNPFPATFSMKTKELSENLLVPRSGKMCLRMHRVPEFCPYLVHRKYILNHNIKLLLFRDIWPH
jgi:hypothetical protein